MKVIIYLIHFLSKLPMMWQQQLVSLIANVLIKINIPRIQVMATNLIRCFPRLSNVEQRQLLHRSICSMCSGVLNSVQANQAECLSFFECDYVGIEHLTAALEQPSGVVLLHPHLTHLDLAGRYMFNLIHDLGSSRPLGYTYRPAHNATFNQWQVMMRPGHPIPANDIRSMVNFLKSKGVLMVFPDHDMGPQRSVFSSFFGIQTATSTGFSKLVNMTQSICLPISLICLKPGYYRLSIEPPLTCQQTPQALADWMNTWIEAIVKKAPEQYYWIHRRFKTRPEGEKRFYSP
ncbi:MAG: hypothetical protein CMF51_02490 [Legionellales bacterium]|nr:hypothetical protein [Legionellales bacterium]